MKDKNTISEAVIKRLPRYLRLMGEMLDRDERRVSSSYISKQLGLTASQVRQDLNNFGEFGHQGYGYDAKFLREQIESIIGLTKTYNMILLGVGNIGKALSNYGGFMRDGFVIKAAFDVAIEKPYREGEIDYYPVSQLEQYVAGKGIDIAIVALPKSAAQEAADRVIALGIHAIWNFAPTELKCPDCVKVENINMSESLYTLCFRINN